MPSRSRFVCASSALKTRSLLRKSRRAVWTCLGVGAAVHLSLMRIVGPEAEQKAARPLTTQFIKRQPRLSKPLELKKRPEPKQRHMRRQMVSVKAKLKRGEKAAGFHPSRMLT